MSTHGDAVARPSPIIVPAADNPAPTVDIPYTTTDPEIAGVKGIHVGAVVTIILTLFIFFGAIYCVFRTSVSLSKLLRRHRGHPEESEGWKGGARKLRKMLVIGLLLSDCLIAVSSFWPAVVALAQRGLEGEKCDLPGFMLASALWWQYGFSLTIAITTYVALRHPLSVAKDFAERGSTPIVAIVIVVGAVQAIVWKAVHGFHPWRDTCYYAPPSSLAAELIQFLPRLITSVVITTIYIPLIHFLRRPDMSSLYLSPKASAHAVLPDPDHPSSQPSSSDTAHDAQTPPWEKLNFPSFHLEEHRDSSAILGAGLFASAFLPPKSSSRPSTPKTGKSSAKRSTLADSGLVRPGPPLPKSSGGRPRTAPNAAIPKAILEAPLETPSLSVGSPALQPPAPLAVTRIPAIRTEIPRNDWTQSARPSADHRQSLDSALDPNHSPPRTMITPSSVSQTSSTTLTHEPLPRPTKDLRVLNGDVPRALTNYHFDWQRDTTRPEGDHLQVTLMRPALIRGNAASKDCASFRGMLELDPIRVPERESARSPGGVTRPSSGTGAVKSLASVMNRSASSFLLWFPLTHLVICALTIARYTSYAVTGVDGPALEAMTTLVVLGQSAADVIIFGFIERRTRHRYRHEVGKSTAAPLQGQRHSQV